MQLQVTVLQSEDFIISSIYQVYFFDVDITFILQASEPITASFTHRMASWLQSPSGTGRSARRHLIAWRRHNYKPLHVLQDS